MAIRSCDDSALFQLNSLSREVIKIPLSKSEAIAPRFKSRRRVLISELDLAASPKRCERTNTRQKTHFVWKLLREMSGEHGCSDCQPVSRGGTEGAGETDNSCGGTVAYLAASIAQSRVSNILLVFSH